MKFRDLVRFTLAKTIFVILTIICARAFGWSHDGDGDLILACMVTIIWAVRETKESKPCS